MLSDPSFLLYPAEPYASIVVGPTDSSGTGNFTFLVHEGNPGLYGVTLEVDGRMSSPVFFYIKSNLTRIEITQEPSRAPGVSGLGGAPITAAGSLQSDGSWLWPVGVPLEQPPVLRLTDASGQPVRSCKVTVTLPLRSRYAAVPLPLQGARLQGDRGGARRQHAREAG